MNSEKVKEIKKALKQNIKSGLGYEDNNKFCNVMFSDILTLINELESENEILKINMHETENLSFQINQMNGNLIIENQKLKDRIAELEKKIENGTLVELQTKVNDTVFWITSNFEIVKVIVSIIRITKYGIVYEIEEENGCKYSMFNVEFFPTKAEAEARLKELQEKQR